MRLVVDLDRQMLEELERRLGTFSKKAPNALSNAINRAVTNVNSNVKKEVRKEYNIKASDIQPTLKITKATKASLRGEVKSSGSPIGLDKFRVSPKTVNPRRKTPIKAGVKKGNIKKVLGAFIADIHGNKVFEREGRARLPIKRLFGPSVPQMLDNDEVRTTIEQQGHQTFETRLDHEINRILGSGNR
ncbi:phage tail protein [Ureibacillus chungkukjangi]|uniref:phage tail protein n=1 Tax=Ureibacillus chungkukjangi TaxID=1202712 RepID=UPI00384B8208